MDWLQRFQNRSDIDLEHFKEEKISELERFRIGYSIAQFQRGESSEARDYLAKSEIFSIESGDPVFYEESKLFVKEENFHSDLLKTFMQQMQIDLVAESWSDSIFRWVRSWGDIAWSSQVLLTAELLAQVYYPALKAATSSEMLATICERIIEDEEDHILFQAERIARVLQWHNRLYRKIHSALGFVLFWGTTFVLWFEHQEVLSESLTYWQYITACLDRHRYFRELLKIHLVSNEVALQDQSSLA